VNIYSHLELKYQSNLSNKTTTYAGFDRIRKQLCNEREKAAGFSCSLYSDIQLQLLCLEFSIIFNQYRNDSYSLPSSCLEKGGVEPICAGQ